MSSSPILQNRSPFCEQSERDKHNPLYISRLNQSPTHGTDRKSEARPGLCRVDPEQCSGSETKECLPILISVVVPFFNEGAHLDTVIRRLAEVLQGINEPFEIVCLDDGSVDGTWPTLKQWAVKEPHIHAIRLSRNFGKEAALAAGLAHARGKAVITIDGDLQHPPELIVRMIEIWRRGEADVVEAKKTEANRQSVLHRLGAGLFYQLLRLLSGIALHNGSDFMLLDRKVVDAWLEMKEFHLFFRGMCAWLGFRRARVYFQVAERVGGVSKWPFLRLFRLAVNGITSFTSLPLHITTFMGVLFLLFSAILGAHTLYMKFSGHAVSGFTTVILLILILGSCVLISLGVIGAYIARIFDEVKGRPRFLVSESVQKPGDDQ